MSNGITLTNIHHPEGDPVTDDHEFNPDSLETIEIDIPMNIQQLAEQAGFEFDAECVEGWIAEDEHIERFAELIRQDEREAIAKIFESKIWAYEHREIVETIRQRGEK